VLVKFRPGTTLTQRRSALRVLRVNGVVDDSQWIGDTLHLRNLVEEDAAVSALVLRQQREVVFAEPNYIRRLQSVPNDQFYSDQWHMDLINMPQAWDINVRAGEGVTVAVIDSGLTTIDTTRDFRIWTGFGFRTFAVPFAKAADFDHSRVRLGVEFTQTGPWLSATGQPLLFDAGGHGTHVAGTIAQQTNNQIGYAGIAHGATLMPVKVCSSPWDVQLWDGRDGIPGFASEEDAGCLTSDIVRGIRYAVDNGASVINLSLGSENASQAELDALRYAVDRGVFVSIAAGNEALLGNPTSFPAAFAAQLNGVVAVGAVTRASQRALYSNTGSYVELAAPGGAGLDGPSDDVWQVVPDPDDLDLFRLSPAFSRYVAGPKAGTSMAAPHVAGLAALLYSHGLKNPAAIEAAMKKFARDLGAAGRDDQFGYGLIDARATLLGSGLRR
jgi:serine protease